MLPALWLQSTTEVLLLFYSHYTEQPALAGTPVKNWNEALLPACPADGN